jgi:hypothetical protein
VWIYTQSNITNTIVEHGVTKMTSTHSYYYSLQLLYYIPSRSLSKQ